MPDELIVDGDANDRQPHGLYAEEEGRDLDERRNIKLKIPLRQHIKLHALRLYSGESASAAVEAALEDYFERRRLEVLGQRIRQVPEAEPL